MNTGHPKSDLLDVRTCPVGHVWGTSAQDKYGCPHCSRRRAKPGASIDDTHPELAARWSATNRYPSSLVSAQANRHAWFRCAEHPHEFVGVVASVVRRGGSCAVCSGYQIRSGFNDLKTLQPSVAEFWHPDNHCGPDEVAAQTHDKYLWKCPSCEFEWEQSVAKRVARGAECTACSGRTLAPGINDFASRHPDLVSEWDGSNDLRPDRVLFGSGYRATWRCRVHKNFTWKAQVRNRSNGTGCPICGGQLVIAGLNDLPTTHPHLISEWNAAANVADPQKLSANSGVVANWNCSTHGMYTQRVCSRARGHGCRKCSFAGSSQGERDLREFLSSLVGEENCLPRFRGISGVREVDIYLPEQKIAIEFNGIYWHSERNGKGRDRAYHLTKHRACKEAGIRLIQVWEDTWRMRRPQVEAMLISKIGVSSNVPISSRTCTVERPSRSEIAALLEHSHIQGPSRGSLLLGLRDSRGELVAAMTVTRSKSTWTINRYAASTTVQGGFGELLVELVREVRYVGGGRIAAYSDNEISVDRSTPLRVSLSCVKFHRTTASYLARSA